MSEKNSQKEISWMDSKVRELDEAHQKYRASGFSFSAAVITLSAGALYGLRDTPARSTSWYFFLPILTGLSQQLFHYMGELKFAHHIFWSAMSRMAREMSEAEAYGQNFKKAEATFRHSNIFFELSEKTAIFAYGSFLACSLAVIGVLGGWVPLVPIVLIGVGLSLYICKRFRSAGK